jgi:hypothetical protein
MQPNGGRDLRSGLRPGANQIRSGRIGIRNGDVRSDIDPSVENDPDVVSMSPGELAFANCSKVVERDEKIYRQKPELI